ncbi:PilW family protein [Chitiniphilus eburneus]|uniref:Prepilin-type N-terminal cleavage/methylation domain-containing protein n=1 Tax=Chitiniphilus eburneus TaxID=2571148 RepID=A0A4U0Q8B7_9NEIS|nr:PilW family protein [Chitiniphilus eburneus]TJZ77507.1 prepilin-type N-terminal cleavage/methylation domain-containing protein [Chitiniphilus eburneus]
MSRRLHHGFTIVELMVGLALALLLALAIANVYVQTRQTFRIQAAQSRVSDDGHYVLDIFKRVLSQAGYRPLAKAGADFKTSFPATSPFAAGQVITANNGTLSIRFYGENTDSASAVATQGNIIGCDASDAPFLTDNQRHTFALKLDGEQLKCNDTVLVGNVLDYSLRFGVYDGTNKQGLKDNGRIITQYIATPTNWDDVLAIRMCVVIVSDAGSGTNLTPEPMSYQDCAGNTVTATDRRIYRNFTSTFQLRNLASNLPS